MSIDFLYYKRFWNPFFRRYRHNLSLPFQRHRLGLANHLLLHNESRNAFFLSCLLTSLFQNPRSVPQSGIFKGLRTNTTESNSPWNPKVVTRFLLSSSLVLRKSLFPVIVTTRIFLFSTWRDFQNLCSAKSSLDTKIIGKIQARGLTHHQILRGH